MNYYYCYEGGSDTFVAVPETVHLTKFRTSYFCCLQMLFAEHYVRTPNETWKYVFIN
jgi:hypothetical protein